MEPKIGTHSDSLSKSTARITHNATGPLAAGVEAWVCYTSSSECSLEPLASEMRSWAAEVWSGHFFATQHTEIGFVVSAPTTIAWSDIN